MIFSTPALILPPEKPAIERASDLKGLPSWQEMQRRERGSKEGTFPFPFFAPRPLTTATTGTFGATGLGGRAVNAGNGVHAGFRFTAPQTGIVSACRINLQSVTASGTYEARLYTDSASSPGTQIGSAWGSQVWSASGNQSHTGGSAAITASVLYWLVFANTAGTPNLVPDTCTDDASYQSGRNNTITSLTNNLTSSEDWRVEVTYQY